MLKNHIIFIHMLQIHLNLIPPNFQLIFSVNCTCIQERLERSALKDTSVIEIWNLRVLTNLKLFEVQITANCLLELLANNYNPEQWNVLVHHHAYRTPLYICCCQRYIFAQQRHLLLNEVDVRLSVKSYRQETIGIQ